MIILMVINPVAGAGAAKKNAGKLARILAGRGHRVDSLYTAPAEIPGLFARVASHPPDAIVAAGGDGTLSMIAHALRGAGAPALALLSSGTANQLARELKLPTEPGEVARLIGGGVVQEIDTSTINAKRFLFNASAGFDALVCREIARQERSTLGYRGYVRPILAALKRYHAPVLRVSVDGSHVAGGYVLVANIRNYGGLFAVAHRAEPSDGLLDVVVAKGSIGSLSRLALYAAAKRVSKLPGITYLRGRRVTIVSKKPCPVQADGEFFGTTPVEIEISDMKLPILVAGEKIL